MLPYREQGLTELLEHENDVNMSLFPNNPSNLSTQYAVWLHVVDLPADKNWLLCYGAIK